MRVIRKASLAPLRGKSIAVIGYGAQGRAQALNLRDAGYKPIIGLPPGSRSRTMARHDRLSVVDPAEATRQSDCLFMLAPDHLHAKLFGQSVAPSLRPGQLLVFAHASSVHFGLVEPPPDVDVVLIAPLGPGKRLRELRNENLGMPCFFSVYRDASGKARRRGLALAAAIGCIPPGAIETTFKEEATGDLFGEQAVLCGGLSALLIAGVQTLVRHGHSPANAYLECVYQIDLIVDLIKSEGLAGMFNRISPTAAHGAILAGPKIIPKSAEKEMDRLYRDIASGAFFVNWSRQSAKRRKIVPRIPAAFRLGESEVLRVLTSRARSKTGD